MKAKAIHFLTLFTSLGTLLCCALPALMVTLGFGAAFVGLVTWFPQLVWISENKLLIFILAGMMLVIGGFMQWQAKTKACPTDPDLRDLCLETKPWSRRIYILSLVIYVVGFFFAFAINWL